MMKFEENNFGPTFRQFCRLCFCLLLFLISVSCSGVKVGSVDGDGYLRLAASSLTSAEVGCNCSDEGLVIEENAWLAEALDESEDDSTLTVFLDYLEEMGLAVAENPPETADDVEIEVQARTGARYHFPIVMNAKVQHFISYYSSVQSRFMHHSLARSQRYLGMMRKILREHDIPEELAYMVLIESGFTTHAYSRAQASGPWQFMGATGRRYGLKINAWVDERRDPVKATYAAAAYLCDLYAMFDSWYLAAAAYNAGEGKIQRAMRRHKTDDFWQMTRFSYLKRETKEYIPRLIAAIMIAKEPEKYGFTDIEYQEAFTYDLVSVEDATDLKVLAWAAGVSVAEISELNPELTYWCTPPKVENYELRVPDGCAQRCRQALDGLPPEKRITFRRHRIRQGDSLSTIARRYNTGIGQIKELNGLCGNRIRAGHDLLIPVRVAGSGPVVFDDRIYKSGSPVAITYTPAAGVSGNATRYRVRQGDSLWKIARRYNLRVAELQAWNNLGRSTSLKPGQTLRLVPVLPQKKASPEVQGKNAGKTQKEVVVLRKGDSLWLISRRYKVDVTDLERWNNLPAETVLQPGQRLVVYR
ncbi:MAG: LysM peptidoglycan-binding domain-containing protein [Deltaproteobacteria bacterium]|nr:LysM peptidoglycan-binding domain-containing protein [Deltaproteobacteria bacterium]